MHKIAILTLLILFGSPASAAAENWEYKVVEVDLITRVRVFANDLLLSGDELEEILAPLGADGWELMGSVSRGGTSLLLVLKRPAVPPIQTRPGQSPAPSPDKGGPVPAPALPTEDATGTSSGSSPDAPPPAGTDGEPQEAPGGTEGTP